jgi:hypothetical protein
MSTEANSPYLVAVSDETRSARKHHAPAAARNVMPIIDVLRDIVPESGRALEIASGTGQHVAAFAEAFPGIDWQPSDSAAEARESIAAWVREAGLRNLNPPLDLDAIQDGWQQAVAGELDLVVCINMVHIAPWAACVGLMKGAGAALSEGGVLYLYGPFMRNGAHTAPSNHAFDVSLRGRDPAWGVRDMVEVANVANAHGLSLDKTVAMPANNFSLILRKRVD